MKTIDQICAGWVSSFEGGYSNNPNDDGNWYLAGAASQRKGQGQLLGSQCGVTAATLAEYYRNPLVTVAMIKAITPALAVAICKELFYHRPGLDRLPWDRVMASVVDFCWGAGPITGIKLLQNMLDQAQDGVINVGGATATAYARFKQLHGEDCLAGAWWAMRERYYEDLIARRANDAGFENGWDRRSASFLPGDPSGWWNQAA